MSNGMGSSASRAAAPTVRGTTGYIEQNHRMSATRIATAQCHQRRGAAKLGSISIMVGPLCFRCGPVYVKYCCPPRPAGLRGTASGSPPLSYAERIQDAAETSTEGVSVPGV